MSNTAVSFGKDGSDGLIHNVQRGRKGTQNGIVRILGYQVLFLCCLPGDHFTIDNIEKQRTSNPSCTVCNVYVHKDLVRIKRLSFSG